MQLTEIREDIIKSLFVHMSADDAFKIDDKISHLIQTQIDTFFNDILNIKTEKIVIKQSVYLLRESSGMYKIGIAKDVHNRAKTLQTSTVHKIEIVCFSKPIQDAHKLENSLHKKYSNLRVSSEWFSLSEANINDIRNEISCI